MCCSSKTTRSSPASRATTWNSCCPTVANISHELRTPLARIRLALELLREGDTARAKGYLVDIEEDLAELELLLDDVMTAARLDLARGSAVESAPPLRLQRVPSQKLLEAAQTHFDKRFPARKLEYNVAQDLPDIDADLNLLRRVLDNLLENAVKFSSPADAIELLGRRSESGSLVIEVRDRNIGIASEESRAHLEPFYRTDRSRALDRWRWTRTIACASDRRGAWGKDQCTLSGGRYAFSD